MSDVPVPTPQRRSARTAWLRRTLRLSQQEGVAASLMTATSDHFFNAFAIFLKASLNQMGWVTGLPQLFGAFAQLMSVWVANHFHRKTLITSTAILQAVTVLGMGILAMLQPDNAALIFIGLAAVYHSLMNIIQPHWRSWMGSIVPERRRGAFFAARTKLTMAASLAVFLIGGALLTGTDNRGQAGVGFLLLFAIAAVGRLISAGLLSQMHDPEPHHRSQGVMFRQTLRNFRQAWKDKTFRQYSLFVAGMLAMVAISAPYFAVYMLEHLKFTYLEFVLCSVASVLAQFLTLGFWGRFSDRFGNRLVMVITSCFIPTLPVLWLFSENFYYIILVQVLSGFFWSGFTLSTANYLYDIRPFRSGFATYAALQSALSATLVFFGAISGGYVATHAEYILATSKLDQFLSNPLFLVFLLSALLRCCVGLWFIPRLKEPRVRPRPQILNLVFRVARFNAISGITLDWLTVARKKRSDQD